MNSDMSLNTVKVFSKGDCLGNQAAVAVLDYPVSGTALDALAQSLVPSMNASALCVVFLERQGGSSLVDSYGASPLYRIQCFSPSGPIGFCGHGLMAAAHQLLVLRNSLSSVALISGSRGFVAERLSQGVRLACPRITTTVQRAPEFARRCFVPAPKTVASAQGTAGYWIFSYPDGTDLAQLRVNYSYLKHCGKRAVIATSLRQPQRAGQAAVCQIRYFAPQYGVNEDQATGSACVVIADFWQKQLKKSHFYIIQQSRGGGYMEVECNRNRILLSGNACTLV